MSFEEQLIDQLVVDDFSFTESAPGIFQSIFESGREKIFSSKISSLIIDVQKEIDDHCSDNHLHFIDEIRALMEKRSKVDKIIKDLELVRDEDLGRRAQDFLSTLNQMHDIKKMIWASERQRLSLQIPLSILNLVQKITLLLKDESLEEGIRELKRLEILFNTSYSILPEELFLSIQLWIPLQYKNLKKKADDDLKKYFSRQKESSTLIGEKAIDLWRERKPVPNATNTTTNTTITVNTFYSQMIKDAQILKVLLDLPSLLNIIHIMDILGERDDFNSKFSKLRETQCRLLLRFPTTKLVEADFSSFCKKILGFLILDFYLLRSPPPFLYGDAWPLNNWKNICGAIFLYSSDGDLGLSFIKETITQFMGALQPFISLFSLEEIIDSFSILSSRWIQENKDIWKDKFIAKNGNDNILSTTIMEAIGKFVEEYYSFTLGLPKVDDNILLQTIDQLVSGSIKKKRDDIPSMDFDLLLKTWKDLTLLSTLLEREVPKLIGINK